MSSQFRHKFSNITVFTRSASNDAAKTLQARGVQVVEVDYTQTIEELKRHFVDIKVFVDILGNGHKGSGLISRDKLMRAAAASGNINVYVPSDYGM